MQSRLCALPLSNRRRLDMLREKSSKANNGSSNAGKSTGGAKQVPARKKSTGNWNPDWEPFAKLDPAWTEKVMAMAIVRCGVKCQVTYRALNNPHLDRRVVESRRSYGVSMFAPKGLQGARELFRAIKRGESISLLNDQKFNGGVAAPLFGITAHTAPGPSSFALRYRIPLQPMSVQRPACGLRR